MAEEDVGEEMAKVVELRPGIDLTDEQRMLHSRRREQFCSHGPYDLDREEQRTYCRKCKREVPVFEVLEHLTRDIEHYIASRKEFARRSKNAADELDSLERELKNARARRRRLRAQGATVERDEVMERVRRLRERVHYKPGLLVLYAADEETAFEVNQQLRLGTSALKIDPLLGPQCWRVGVAGDTPIAEDVKG